LETRPSTCPIIMRFGGFPFGASPEVPTVGRMTSPLTKRLQALLSLLSALLALAVIAVAVGYFLLRGSLPQLDGERPLAGLSAPVKIERDSLGVPLITAANRLDAARALGFLHGQDRFF